MAFSQKIVDLKQEVLAQSRELFARVDGIAEENTLFSGDTLFYASIGRTDFPGCSFKELADSIHNKLWNLPDETQVFPGHMGPTMIGFEKENNPFV